MRVYFFCGLHFATSFERSSMGIWIDVRALREERGWLQRQAAEELGVSRSYLSAVENCKRGISLRMMEAVIKTFGVKYEDFVQVPLDAEAE
jgi:transcriptional regulator with XRE-family HTH domain